jgi:hypothetical protein
MIVTIFPSVSTEVKLERHWHHCGRLGGQIHSRVRARTISDTKVEQAFQQRLRCEFCGTTWALCSQTLNANTLCPLINRVSEPLDDQLIYNRAVSP